MKNRRHRWSQSDDEALRIVTGQLQHLYGARNKPLDFWTAVAGKLMPGLVVSPAACAKRWSTLTKEKAGSTLAQASNTQAAVPVNNGHIVVSFVPVRPSSVRHESTGHGKTWCGIRYKEHKVIADEQPNCKRCAARAADNATLSLF